MFENIIATIKERIDKIEKDRKRTQFLKPFYWYCTGKLLAYRYCLLIIRNNMKEE